MQSKFKRVEADAQQPEAPQQVEVQPQNDQSVAQQQATTPNSQAQTTVPSLQPSSLTDLQTRVQMLENQNQAMLGYIEAFKYYFDHLNAPIGDANLQLLLLKLSPLDTQS